MATTVSGVAETPHNKPLKSRQPYSASSSVGAAKRTSNQLPRLRSTARMNGPRLGAVSSSRSWVTSTRTVVHTVQAVARDTQGTKTSMVFSSRPTHSASASAGTSPRTATIPSISRMVRGRHAIPNLDPMS